MPTEWIVAEAEAKATPTHLYPLIRFVSFSFPAPLIFYFRHVQSYLFYFLYFTGFSCQDISNWFFGLK